MDVWEFGAEIFWNSWGENYGRREKITWTTYYSPLSITSMIELKYGGQWHVARMTVIINACVQHRTWRSFVRFTCRKRLILKWAVKKHGMRLCTGLWTAVGDLSGDPSWPLYGDLDSVRGENLGISRAAIPVRFSTVLLHGVCLSLRLGATL
jgi:hypothetical protein